MKHTPGPWKLDSVFPDMDGYKVRGGSLAFRKGPRLIAVVKNQGERPIVEDSLSDAKLIAAAPDLLRLLKRCVPLLEPHSIALQAKEVIAQAEGGDEPDL